MSKPSKRISVEDFPHFKIENIEEVPAEPNNDGNLKLLGHFEKSEQVHPTEMSWDWFLRTEKHENILGRWEWTDRKSGAATVWVTGEKENFSVGMKLPFLDAYWQAYKVWMIVDPKNEWEKVAFKATPAISRPYSDGEGNRSIYVRPVPGGVTPGPGETLVKGGWDHEHCELCNVSLEPGDSGYLDLEDHWVCEKCYKKYVGPRDLSFALFEIEFPSAP